MVARNIFSIVNTSGLWLQKGPISAEGEFALDLSEFGQFRQMLTIVISHRNSVTHLIARGWPTTLSRRFLGRGPVVPALNKTN
jgi:hypothetical protein